MRQRCWWGTPHLARILGPLLLSGCKSQEQQLAEVGARVDNGWLVTDGRLPAIDKIMFSAHRSSPDIVTADSTPAEITIGCDARTGWMVMFMLPREYRVGSGNSVLQPELHAAVRAGNKTFRAWKSDLYVSGTEVLTLAGGKKTVDYLTTIDTLRLEFTPTGRTPRVARFPLPGLGELMQSADSTCGSRA